MTDSFVEQAIAANLQTLRQIAGSTDWLDARVPAIRGLTRHAELLTLLEIIRLAAEHHLPLPDGVEQEVRKLIRA